VDTGFGQDHAQKKDAHARLCIDDVALRFGLKRGSEVTALERISLDVADQEFAVIVGPSGCGKTSLLRSWPALIEPTEGSITLDGTLVTGLDAIAAWCSSPTRCFPGSPYATRRIRPQDRGGVSPADAARVRQAFLSPSWPGRLEDAYPKHLSGA